MKTVVLKKEKKNHAFTIKKEYNFACKLVLFPQ